MKMPESGRSKNAFKLLIAIYTCAAVASIPIYAQENMQTPANAHIFLSQLANENRVRIKADKSYKTITTHTFDRVNKGYLTRVEARVIDPVHFNVKFSSKCKTNIFPINSMETVEYIVRDTGYNYKGTHIPGTETVNDYINPLKYVFENGIDWSRITSIGLVDGAAIKLNGPYLYGGYATLYFESKDMAARAEYALNVIRMSCDPVANTGF